jgi:phosphatidate cytidylyltransferase
MEKRDWKKNQTTKETLMKGFPTPVSAHQRRILTALILLAIVGAAIAAGGWAARLLVLAASSAALHEFFSFYWPRELRRDRVWLGLVLGAALILSQAGGPVLTLAVISLLVPVVGLRFLFAYGTGDSEARLGHFAPVLHGLLYIPCSLQLALYLSPAEQCLVILAAMASDSGGYYAGTLCGKHKLWPVVSPAKSWEGLAGGFVLCLLACLVWGTVGNAGGLALPVFSMWGWLLVGILLHLASAFGDLFESALKRSLRVKDSGTILPGHGGVLDRIDSLLFALPVYFVLRQFVS